MHLVSASLLSFESKINFRNFGVIILLFEETKKVTDVYCGAILYNQCLLIWSIRAGVCDRNRIVDSSLSLLTRGGLFSSVICDNRSRSALGSNMSNKGSRPSRPRSLLVSFEKLFSRGGKKWISLCYPLNISLGVLLTALSVAYWCIYLHCLACFFNHKSGFLHVCVMPLCPLFPSKTF